MSSKENCILTYTGKLVDPCNVQRSDVAFMDLVTVLPRLARFSGHSKHFYSVAQHSVLVSAHCTSLDAQRWGLMHDAAEVYLHDIPTPLKRRMQIGGESYSRIEERALRAIGEAFGLCWPIPEEVWRIDQRALASEFNQLMTNHGPELLAEPLSCDIRELPEDFVREQWCHRFSALGLNL